MFSILKVLCLLKYSSVNLQEFIMFTFYICIISLYIYIFGSRIFLKWWSRYVPASVHNISNNILFYYEYDQYHRVDIMRYIYPNYYITWLVKYVPF